MKMHSIKANFPIYIKSEIKFKEWKVKENSKLSKGSILFTYEFESNGVAKLEKYKCQLNGITVKQLCDFKPGTILKNGVEILKYEKCPHEIIIDVMCGVCGEDLRQREETVNKISRIASIPIVHAEPRIKVSEKEAHDIGKKDLINLVKNKKLVLLVDLDHTLIHTTNENVNPNLKEVYHYELVQKGIWYHTKFRPGCKKFLEQMSKLYELHMVTFGERNYAHTIANFMDPDKRYFHDRILSRNEIINPISKTDNLKALFPRGDLMVCIIDDREDVWNYARNLIVVKPYVYFKNTGDINDPHAAGSRAKQHRTDLPNIRKRKINANNSNNPVQTVQASKDLNQATSSINKTNDDENSNNSESSNNSTDTSSSNSSSGSNSKKDELPGKTEQEKLENKDSDDPDDYLVYLQEILKKIHDEYYNIYENRLKSQNKNLTSTEIDESDLPDVKKVIPLIKSRILDKVAITFSGVVPVGTSPQYDLKRQRCYLMAKSLGAKVNENLVLPDENDKSNDSDTNTNYKDDENEDLISQRKIPKKISRRYHYSFDDEYSSNSSGGELKSEEEEYEEIIQYYNNPDSDTDQIETKLDTNKKLIKKKLKRFTTHLVAAKHGTSKVHDALKSKHPIKVVTPEWLIDCNFKWIRCNEDDYKLTKEYDYKTCIFHQEYNMHQKYSSNSQKNLFSHNNTKRSVLSVTFTGKKESNNEDKKIATNLKKNESTDSLSLFDNKAKKRKSNENQDDQGISTSRLSLDIDLINEDIFEMMDKEVDEELDDDDDEDESNVNESDVDENNQDTVTSNDDIYNDIKKSKNDSDSSDEASSNSFKFKSGPTSVSSTSSNNSSINSIDDEFGLELESLIKKQG